MAIETLNGIKYPTDITDTINSGTATVGGILIDNDLNLGSRVTTLENQTPQWLDGHDRPTAALNPKVGDFYVQSNGALWRYLTITANNTTTTSWVEVASLAGPQGNPGAAPTISSTPTSTGYILTVVSGGNTVNLPITNGTNGTTPEISVSNVPGGHQISITSGSSTNKVTVLNGTNGTNGTSCSATLTNSSTPGAKTLTIVNTDGNGNTSTSTCDIYQGLNGADGATIFTGTAVSGTGSSISIAVTGSKTGDLYINTSTGDYYKATAANVWSRQGSLQGPGANYEVVTDASNTPTISLTHKKHYKCTGSTISSVSITSNTLTEGQCAWLTFESGSSTSFGIDSGITYCFKGDDTEDGIFNPVAGKKYSIDFRYTPWGLMGVVVSFSAANNS